MDDRQPHFQVALLPKRSWEAPDLYAFTLDDFIGLVFLSIWLSCVLHHVLNLVETCSFINLKSSTFLILNS